MTAPSSNGDGITLLQSLLSSINSKAVAKRALFAAVPLEIGPGFKISVKGYIIFKRQVPKRSCYIWLEGEKPQIATGVTAKMADDSARVVEKIEIKKAFKFGGAQIIFTPEEVTKLRHFDDPVIRIIGFKPMSMLPIWATTRSSTFIYPSEDDFVGSTRVFSALQQKMLKDEKMALTWFVPRKNATPVLAALFPGAEHRDDEGLQIMPPGMWLEPLPFADDIRSNPETTLIRSPEPLIDCMRDVVAQLQLPKALYDPSKYPNPSLQWHYRILQAMALEEDLPEKPEDKTIPKYKQIAKRVGSLAVEWGQQLQKCYQEYERDNKDDDASTVPAKRSAPATQGELPLRADKKVRTMALSDAGCPTDEEMERAFAKQTVAKLTVAQLTAWLKAKSLRVKGTKGVLVEQVQEYFENK